MKIKLLQDIKRFGRKGEIYEVSDGYASSYLIPRGLASHASEQDIIQFEKNKDRNQSKRNKKDELDAQLFAKINNSIISIQSPANERGTLFESINSSKIASEIQGLKKEHIKLKRPIKERGSYDIPIVVGDHKGSVHLMIEG
ncbi:MAG: 50S ribosomal protein L9 [Patescibacteria group bacterium]